MNKEDKSPKRPANPNDEEIRGEDKQDDNYRRNKLRLADEVYRRYLEARAVLSHYPPLIKSIIKRVKERKSFKSDGSATVEAQRVLHSEAEKCLPRLKECRKILEEHPHLKAFVQEGLPNLCKELKITYPEVAKEKEFLVIDDSSGVEIVAGTFAEEAKDPSDPFFIPDLGTMFHAERNPPPAVSQAGTVDLIGLETRIGQRFDTLASAFEKLTDRLDALVNSSNKVSELLHEYLPSLQTSLDDVLGTFPRGDPVGEVREASAVEVRQKAQEGGDDRGVHGTEAEKAPPAAPGQAAPPTPAIDPPVPADPFHDFEVVRAARGLSTDAAGLAARCRPRWPDAAKDLDDLQRKLVKLDENFCQSTGTGTGDERCRQLESRVFNWADAAMPLLHRLDVLQSGKNDHGENLPSPLDRESASQLGEVRDRLFRFIQKYGGWDLYPIRDGDLAADHASNIEVVGSARPQGKAAIRQVLHPGYRKVVGSAANIRKPRVILSG